MQGLGGPDEDRRGGFERGGWALPLVDEEVSAFLNDIYGHTDAFLFGRRTYEIFAGSWGTMHALGGYVRHRRGGRSGSRAEGRAGR
jgi:dihydrofolate reductase